MLPPWRLGRDITSWHKDWDNLLPRANAFDIERKSELVPIVSTLRSKLLDFMNMQDTLEQGVDGALCAVLVRYARQPNDFEFYPAFQPRGVFELVEIFLDTGPRFGMKRRLALQHREGLLDYLRQ
ncbi:hypothetical protein X636_16475 [Pandoraea pnomenusa]|nr:hypothetical protein X636_16475 [Pandoraea pnomenusa]